ncbi:anti-repressor SinI family protein [Fictibacillus nanhaiensis]
MENTITLDREWIELMKEARDQGFTKEQIIEFLKNPQLFVSKI